MLTREQILNLDCQITFNSQAEWFVETEIGNFIYTENPNIIGSNANSSGLLIQTKCSIGEWCNKQLNMPRRFSKMIFEIGKNCPIVLFID